MAVHKLYIADASVLIKWAVLEMENIREAFLFRDDFFNEKVVIIVPGHCFPEVANYLSRKEPKIGPSFVSFLINSSIEENCLTLSVVQRAFQLVLRHHGISFYDASYHALAIEKKGIFLTADAKYFQKTYKEGAIQLLKNYGKKR